MLNDIIKNIERKLLSLFKMLAFMLLFLWCPEPADAQAIINRDRVYHYVERHRSGTQVFTFDMGFGGDVEMNGHTYTAFKTLRTRLKEANMPWRDVPDEGRSYVFYLREEGPRLYMNRAYHLKTYPHSWYRANILHKDTVECLLYDFSLNEGESYISQESTGRLIRLRVKEVFEFLDPGGKSCRGQILEYKYTKSWGEDDDSPYDPDLEIKVVECYGHIDKEKGVRENPGDFGWLCGLYVIWTTDFGFTPPFPHSRSRCRLAYISDTDGNVIWPEGYKVNSDLEDIVMSEQGHSATDSPLYDLMGRKVSQPIPGSLYIRAGKKFVMPRE